MPTAEYDLTSSRSKHSEWCCSPKTFAKKLNRKKSLAVDLLATPLRRCLTTLDICLLGVGHMIGAGIYVLTGTVSKTVTGPSIVISYLIAGVTSFLAALCYAEFGARVPKAGSAYVYTYVTMGEVWAFIIGWDVILEQMIGAASVARAWSGYVDGLLDGKIANGTEAYVGKFHVDFFGDYPDFVAFGFCVVVSLFLSLGAKGSSYFNSVLTSLNLIVVVFIVCAGIYYADVQNWTTAPGGFVAFGFTGIIAGAAKCFFAFVGFDSIATSGEEAKNPRRSIPLATFFSMVIATAAYTSMSVILTLLVRYDQINSNSAFPDAFRAHNVTWAYYVVSIGALAGMTTSMFGSLFALPRCVYAMASDGLLFKYLSYVHPKTQTPVLTLITCGVFTAIIALLFNIDKLVEFMSIGTLMAYTMVSACVIILRYRPVVSHAQNNASHNIDLNQFVVDQGGRPREGVSFAVKLFSHFSPGVLPAITTIVLTFSLIAISLLLQFAISGFTSGAWWPILLLVVFLIIVIACLVVLCVHRQSSHKLSFEVPWVPFLPACSIFCNIYLMTNLDVYAWIRFAVWMGVGMLIYLLYGIHHSRNTASANTSLSSAPTTEMTAVAEKKQNSKIMEATHF